MILIWMISCSLKKLFLNQIYMILIYIDKNYFYKVVIKGRKKNGTFSFIFWSNICEITLFVWNIWFF